MKMDLSKIVLDKTLYPRSAVSEFNVARLLAALETGAKLPPLLVEAKTNRLVDGWHRYEAYLRKEISKVDVEQKVYANEADLFADAVRANIGHGDPLDQHTIRSAVIRLTEYGYTRERISEVVRLPMDKLERIERGFASDADTGKPVALKGGLSHLAGTALTPQQREINRHYSGGKASFYVRQLADLLEHNMWPDNSQAFANEMNRLVSLWEAITKAAA
jgi:hypothetical protein